jgi:hypothetical protein
VNLTVLHGRKVNPPNIAIYSNNRWQSCGNM